MATSQGDGGTPLATVPESTDAAYVPNASMNRVTEVKANKTIFFISNYPIVSKCPNFG